MLETVSKVSHYDSVPASHVYGISSLWSDLFPIGILNELTAHPFLAACRNNEISQEMLQKFLVQHQYYSRYFTRYLCAMMASLPSTDDVRELSKNLVEETGLDKPGGVTHADLYISSLKLLGAQPGSQPALPATLSLIDSMYRYCRSPDALDGLSALCLGAEAIVPVIYGAVIQGFNSYGATDEALHYFRLHVEEDEDHAITMRKVIDRLLVERPYRISKVHAIAQDMVMQRMEMFDAVMKQGQPS